MTGKARNWLRPALAAAIALVVSVALPGRGFAEQSELRVASQYGFGFLPMMVMQEKKLLEEQLARTGQADVAVRWATFGGGNVMNEALLSGNLDIATGGVTPFITLWAKTRGNIEVKALGGLGSLPLWLMSRNPAVKTLADFTEADKIAVTAVKVSNHAILLQMAAAKLWGPDNYTRLDPLTVSLAQPDGVAALLSGKSEINAHFTAPPFQYFEAKRDGIHRVTGSEEILGGPATFVVAYATDKFRTGNPRLYDAFVQALQRSVDIIKSDKPGAAAIYAKLSRGPETEQEIAGMLADPANDFTTTPQGTMAYLSFMQSIGTIKVKATSWREMFFPNVGGDAGS